MPDYNTAPWNRFQEAQRKLNLVKRHAHEIVGVKREQVHMVVENFSRPGTYDITVHENGRVSTQNWVPPTEDFEVPASFPTVDENKVIDEVAEVLEPQVISPVVLQKPFVQQGVTEVLPPNATPVVEEETPKKEDKEEEVLVSEAVVEVAPAPEPAAAPRPHRGRGRPKKSV